MSDTTTPTTEFGDDLFDEIDLAKEYREFLADLETKILNAVKECAPSQAGEQFIHDLLGTELEDKGKPFALSDTLVYLVDEGKLVKVVTRGVAAYRLPPEDEPVSAPADEEQRLPTTDGAKLRSLTRARAIDKEISKSDSIIAGLKEDLKQAKEEREGYVYELRKCIREAGQGDLFDTGDVDPCCVRCGVISDELSAGRPGEFCNRLICPDCQRTLTEIEEQAERERPIEQFADEPLTTEDPGFTLDDLAYTRRSVRESLDDLANFFTLEKMLWTIKPDLPVEKVTAEMVHGWEETLAAAAGEAESE